MTTTTAEVKALDSNFNLFMLSTEARRIINRAASDPSLLQQFIHNPEATWVEFGQGISPSERRTLELLAEIFLPETSIEILPKVTMDSVWVSNR